MNEYEQQAQKFLSDTKTEFKAEFVKHGKYFLDDKETRDIYKITLTRGQRQYIFNFGQSLKDSGFRIISKTTGKERCYFWQSTSNKFLTLKEAKMFVTDKLGTIAGLDIKDRVSPSTYAVLSCLTKYDPVSFKNFCSEYGYNEDSIKALGVYKAVVDEYNNLKMLFSDDEIEQLREIN